MCVCVRACVPGVVCVCAHVCVCVCMHVCVGRRGVGVAYVRGGGVCVILWGCGVVGSGGAFTA